MAKYYWDTESDSLTTRETLIQDFDLFRDEYESVKDYIDSCMWYNNGTLIPLYSHIKSLKEDLERYNDFYEDSEREDIRNHIESLSRLYLEV